MHHLVVIEREHLVVIECEAVSLVHLIVSHHLQLLIEGCESWNLTLSIFKRTACRNLVSAEGVGLVPVQLYWTSHKPLVCKLCSCGETSDQSWRCLSRPQIAPKVQFTEYTRMDTRVEKCYQILSKNFASIIVKNS